MGVDLYKMLNDYASQKGETRAAGVNKTRSSMVGVGGWGGVQHGLNKIIIIKKSFLRVC